MRRFQNDDENAFVLLVNRFKNRLFNFILRFGNSVETAEDLTQETLIRLYSKKHKYREIAAVSTWLFTIAKNLALSEMRKRRQRNTWSLSDLGFEEEDLEIPSEHDFNASLSWEVTEIIVQRTLRQLPAHYRTVILLRDIQHLSYDEISQIIGISIGTVKSRINRGRLYIREALISQYGYETVDEILSSV